MQFTAIIHQLGNQVNLEKTVENLKTTLDCNIIYLKDKTLFTLKKEEMSATPLEAVKAGDLEFRDIIVYIKSGSTLHPDYEMAISQGFDELAEPKISVIYTDYVHSTKNYSITVFVPTYDRIRWLQTAQTLPVIAVRKTPELQVTMSPDINYLNYLNQSFPIVKITTPLVTLHG